MSHEDEPEQPTEEDILDVTLDEEELPLGGPPPAEGGDTLVIEAEHLWDLPEVPAKGASAPDFYPSVEPPADVDKVSVGKKGFVAPDIVGVLMMILAGAIGGFVAWLLVEPFVTDPVAGAEPVRQLLTQVLGAMGLFAACVGGMIGMALGSVEGLTSRTWEKAGKGALLGLGIGGAGGFVGGVIGQVMYGALGGGRLSPLTQIIVRGMAWALVGLFVGLGQGVMMRARPKIVNGLIGGLIGGLVGGLLFDPVAAIVAFATQLTGGTVGGEVSRLVAIVVMGAACGAAIGLVEQARKQAWLRIVEGPLLGKEFIIYRSPTLIGSSPKCDITLALDKSVAPQHASISQQGSNYVLTDLDTPSGTRVNGHLIRSHRLRSGDRIRIGQTTSLYADRLVREEAQSGHRAAGYCGQAR